MSVDFHFLNVGAGDCTIIHFPARNRGDASLAERVMMVDFCHHPGHDEYEDVLGYYKRNFRNADGSIKPIFRLICTHPHHDHIFGLQQLLDDPDITILNFWDVDHSFEPADFSGHFNHRQDWSAYLKLRGDDSPSTVIRTSREDAPRQYWNDDEDRISVLVPSKDLQEHAHKKEDGTKRKRADVEIDEISYMLVVRINTRKVLLAGDGRATPAWDSVRDNCDADIRNVAVLKAEHHGQESAFHEACVKRMNPAVIVFSNSETEDGDHGADSSYQSAVPDAKLLKTCDHATILVKVPFDQDKPIEYSFR